MEEGKWDFDIPFQDANLDNADFKAIKNLPGQIHRTDVTGDKATSKIMGRLAEVVHGFERNGSGQPCTLVVFEWFLVSPAGSHRLENVEIDVIFQAHGRRWDMSPGEELAMWDPWPTAIFPQVPDTSLTSSALVERKSEGGIKLTAGYEPYLSGSGHKTKGITLKYERVDYRSVTGTLFYYNKNSGRRNAVRWTIRENETLQSGVQYHIRTAVLLNRCLGDSGRFKVTVVTRSNVWPLQRCLEQPLRAIGLKARDDPIYFDPDVLPGSIQKSKSGIIDVASKPTRHDWRNLGAVDITEYRLEEPAISIAPRLEGDEKNATIENVDVAVEEAEDSDHD